MDDTELDIIQKLCDIQINNNNRLINNLNKLFTLLKDNNDEIVKRLNKIENKIFKNEENKNLDNNINQPTSN